MSHGCVAAGNPCFSSMRLQCRNDCHAQVASLEGTPADEQQSAEQAVAAIREAVGALSVEDSAHQQVGDVGMSTSRNLSK